jgi:hypothetical protein
MAVICGRWTDEEGTRAIHTTGLPVTGRFSSLSATRCSLPIPPTTRTSGTSARKVRPRPGIRPGIFRRIIPR